MPKFVVDVLYFKKNPKAIDDLLSLCLTHELPQQVLTEISSIAQIQHDDIYTYTLVQEQFGDLEGKLGYIISLYGIASAKDPIWFHVSALKCLTQFTISIAKWESFINFHKSAIVDRGGNPLLAAENYINQLTPISLSFSKKSEALFSKAKAADIPQIYQDFLSLEESARPHFFDEIMSHTGALDYNFVSDLLDESKDIKAIYICLYGIVFTKNPTWFHTYATQKLVEVSKFHNNQDMPAESLLEALIFHHEALSAQGGKAYDTIVTTLKKYALSEEILPAHLIAASKLHLCRDLLITEASFQIKPVSYEAPNSHYIYRDSEISHTRNVERFRLDQGKILADYSNPKLPKLAILDSEMRIVWRSSDDVILGGNEQEIVINDNVGFLDDTFTKFNICHFLFDKLTRIIFMDKALHGAKANSPDGPSKVFIGVENNYISKFLKFCNLENIVPSDKKDGPILFHIEKLFIVSTSIDWELHPAFLGTKICADFMKNYKNLASGSSQYSSKIFIDRQNIGSRQIVNNSEVKKELRKAGYDIIDAAQMTLEEQIITFKNCTDLIGVHGAGLTNLIFMENGRVLELLPPLCATTSYSVTANGAGLTYDSLICDDAEGLSEPINYHDWEHDVTLNRRNIIIDIDKLRQKLI